MIFNKPTDGKRWRRQIKLVGVFEAIRITTYISQPFSRCKPIEPEPFGLISSVLLASRFQQNIGMRIPSRSYEITD